VHKGVETTHQAPSALGVCRGDAQSTGTGRLAAQQLALERSVPGPADPHPKVSASAGSILSIGSVASAASVLSVASLASCCSVLSGHAIRAWRSSPHESRQEN
jgi:hypothetical protein